jgi:hypothetical protein
VQGDLQRLHFADLDLEVAGVLSRAIGAGLVASALVAYAGHARAEPQWNAALLAGAAGVGTGSVWPATEFYGGLRGDLLFLRSGPRDVGLGPALELSTAGFSDARLGAGPAVLVPLGDLFAFELSPGAFVRTGSGALTGGVSARGFLGVRTYNFTGSYALGGGLLLGIDQDLGGPREHAVVIAAQVDALVLALPVVLLFEWLRGPPSRG